MVTELDKAYLAGIIDGEGYIGIGLNKAGAGGHKNPQHTLRMTISQSNQPFLVYLRNKWDGIGSICINRGSKQNRTGYKWNISANQAVTILEQVLPYLIIKRTQAELGIELQNRNNYICGRGRGYEVSQEELARRDDIKQKVSELNQREYIYDS